MPQRLFCAELSAQHSELFYYRWREIGSMYGTAIKELIHEDLGDRIMSAIAFSMDIVRQLDSKGDRVSVALPGNFLPYKTY